MIIDGKAIAHDIRMRLRGAVGGLRKEIKLGVFVTTEDYVTQKFVEIKRAAAAEVGVKLDILDYTPCKSTEEFLREMLHKAREYDGLIIQLPLSEKIDLDPVKKLMPITHDVDVFGDTSFSQFLENRLPFLPPVVGAFAEILARNSFHIGGKKVLVIGEGQLVGRPAGIWAGHLGAEVTIANRSTRNMEELCREAEVIILGAGSPGMLKPDMVRDGVVILDAGTSEAGGKLAGDADPLCASKALLFTPVPGGVGPVAVAMIFKNLITLTFKRLGITDFETLQKL